MASTTPTCVQPSHCAKKKATKINQVQLEEEQQPPIMDIIQISDENLIAKKSKLDLRKTCT